LGNPRVLALLQAVCHFAHVPNGFRHRDLRPLVASLLGRELAAYPTGAMIYDLRRLRLHGMIARVPRSSRYVVTPDGMRLAFGLRRIYLRLLQPNWTDLLVDTDQLPTPLRTALSTSTLPSSNSTPTPLTYFVPLHKLDSPFNAPRLTAR
jgi:hypothetical protein